VTAEQDSKRLEFTRNFIARLLPARYDHDRWPAEHARVKRLIRAQFGHTEPAKQLRKCRWSVPADRSEMNFSPSPSSLSSGWVRHAEDYFMEETCR
jgi:hypothetical protein